MKSSATVHGRNFRTHFKTGYRANDPATAMFKDVPVPKEEKPPNLPVDMPSRLARQSGSGPWHKLAGTWNGYTRAWFEAFLNANELCDLEVKLNQKDSRGFVPVIVAAMNFQALLVEFMVSTFTDQLVHLRTNDTNLLNLCCANGFGERICEMVARTYPELMKHNYGGLIRRIHPTAAFANAGRRIPEYFFRNRDTSNDGHLIKSICTWRRDSVHPILNLWSLLVRVRTSQGGGRCAGIAFCGIRHLWASSVELESEGPRSLLWKKLFAMANIFCVGFSFQLWRRPGVLEEHNPFQQAIARFANSHFLEQVLAVILRADKDFDRLIWKQIRKECHLMPSMSRLSLPEVLHVQKGVEEMLVTAPEYTERANKFFDVMGQWRRLGLFTLPIDKRYDIEGNRWRVAIAMAAAKQKYFSGVLPPIPPEVWKFVLRSMCGYGDLSVS